MLSPSLRDNTPEPWLDFKMFDLSKVPPTFLDDPFPFYADLLNGPPALEQEDGSVLIYKTRFNSRGIQRFRKLLP